MGIVKQDLRNPAAIAPIAAINSTWTKERRGWTAQFESVRKVTLPGYRSFAGLGLGQGADDGILEVLTVQALELHVSN
jgi:hypothetical protein